MVSPSSRSGGGGWSSRSQESLLSRLGRATYQHFADPIVSAFTVLNDVGSGAQPMYAVDPETGETVTDPSLVSRAYDLAGLAQTGSLGGVPGGGMALGAGPVRRMPGNKNIIDWNATRLARGRNISSGSQVIDDTFQSEYSGALANSNSFHVAMDKLKELGPDKFDNWLETQRGGFIPEHEYWALVGESERSREPFNIQENDPSLDQIHEMNAASPDTNVVSLPQEKLTRGKTAVDSLKQFGTNQSEISGIALSASRGIMDDIINRALIDPKYATQQLDELQRLADYYGDLGEHDSIQLDNVDAVEDMITELQQALKAGRPLTKEEYENLYNEDGYPNVVPLRPAGLDPRDAAMADVTGPTPNMPRQSALVEQGDVYSAVKIGDRTFIGQDHMQAIDQAREELGQGYVDHYIDNLSADKSAHDIFFYSDEQGNPVTDFSNHVALEDRPTINDYKAELSLPSADMDAYAGVSNPSNSAHGQAPNVEEPSASAFDFDANPNDYIPVTDPSHSQYSVGKGNGVSAIKINGEVFADENHWEAMTYAMEALGWSEKKLDKYISTHPDSIGIIPRK